MNTAKNAREQAIETVLAKLTSDADGPEQMRHVILYRRIAEVRVGIVVIIAVILFAMFFLLYATLWGGAGFAPASLAQWITIALMVLFFGVAWRATSAIQRLEGRTEQFEEALSRYLERREKAANTAKADERDSATAAGGPVDSADLPSG